MIGEISLVTSNWVVIVNRYQFLSYSDVEYQ